MDTNGTGITEVSIRTSDGRVHAFVASAEEVARLQAEVERLRAEVEKLRGERDTLQRRNERYVRELTEALTTRFPPPPTPEEMADPSRWATSDDIQKIISDLEAH